MVMIVKDHEKQAHGFISITRYARYPAHLRTVLFGTRENSQSARGGGRAAAPGGMQRPNARPGLALLGAVTLLRRGAGRDKDPLAARRGANPEPLGARLGDQPGQPGDGVGRVPVRGRPALHQVDVPVLAIVTDDLLVYRVPGE